MSGRASSGMSPQSMGRGECQGCSTSLQSFHDQHLQPARTTMEKLKLSSMGHSQTIKNEKPTPKKLSLGRNTRSQTYAMAAADESWTPAHLPTSPLNCAWNTSPQQSPGLTDRSIGSLMQAERIPRTRFHNCDFKPGMIIEAPLMEEDFMYGASLTSAASALHTDFSITPSHYGYIHTKLRKMIVVALFAQHYLAVPMYTHNGDGLDKKPNPDEFISVLDARVKRNVIQLSDHKPLVANLEPEACTLYSKTTVHFAYPVSRNYQLRVNYLGDLDTRSRGRLMRLFREYMMEGGC